MGYGTCGRTSVFKIEKDGGVWEKKWWKKEIWLDIVRYERNMKGALEMHSKVHVECKSGRVFEIESNGDVGEFM